MTIRNLFMLASAIFFIGIGVAAQQVTLYKFHSYYGKDLFNAKPGRYDSIPKPLFDNTISSLKVPAGLKITLYENKYCMGESFEFYGDVKDLRIFGMLGKVSSFKVETNTRNITQQFITLDNINEALCPSAVLRGDREFDGHGPRMKCDVKLSISADGKSILADIFLSATETQHDWSATEGRWTKKVFELFESNKKIVKIDMNDRSVVEWLGSAAGGETGFGNTGPIVGYSDFTKEMKRKYPDTNFDIWWKQKSRVSANLLGGGYGNNSIDIMPPMQGRLVNKFYLVGDTGGADISDDDGNCRDDTRIQKIEFNKVFVQVEQR
jgi:hypothetical protein